MAASEPTRQSPLRRLLALLRQLVGRDVSRRHGRGHSEERPASSTALDLGDFAVAQLVHDLGIVINVMIGGCERVASFIPRGEANQEIALVRERGKCATLLIRDLLLAASPRPARRGRIDLNHVVTRIADMLSRLTRDYMQLRLRLSPDPVPVLAEALELERILLNLALNSRDAMAPGGTLTIDTAIVAASAGDLRGRIARLRVRDTGRGIEPELHERVVEPFFTTKATGTGLGLSSVAFTVRQLQGTMVIDSVSGRGTSVTVDFPTPDPASQVW